MWYVAITISVELFYLLKATMLSESFSSLIIPLSVGWMDEFNKVVLTFVITSDFGKCMLHWLNFSDLIQVNLISKLKFSLFFILVIREDLQIEVLYLKNLLFRNSGVLGPPQWYLLTLKGFVEFFRTFTEQKRLSTFVLNVSMTLEMNAIISLFLKQM